MHYLEQSKIQPADFCLMVHVIENIRSYAVPKRISDDKAKDEVEYCVCARKNNAAVYAHEILHLFGADDFYEEYYKKIHEYKREFLKGSIMFEAYSLNNARIDELTAQNIGWL